MQKITPFKYAALTTSALMLALTGCANAQTPNSEAQSAAPMKASGGQAPNGYQKMGADVRFANNYDEKSQPGDIENFTVRITSPVTTGVLKLQLREDDGLTYYSALKELEFDLSQGPDHEFELQIGTPNAGKYYLNMMAFVEHANGQTMSRATAIAFNVGGAAQTKNSAAANAAQEAAPSGGIKVMDAEETIRTQGE